MAAPAGPTGRSARRSSRAPAPRCANATATFAAHYGRLVKRRGDKKAIVAVAHSILGIAYHVLRDGQSYRELGGGYFDRLNTDRLTRYHTKRLAVTPRQARGLKPPFSSYLPDAA